MKTLLLSSLSASSALTTKVYEHLFCTLCKVEYIIFFNEKRITSEDFQGENRSHRTSQLLGISSQASLKRNENVQTKKSNSKKFIREKNRSNSLKPHVKLTHGNYFSRLNPKEKQFLLAALRNKTKTTKTHARTLDSIDRSFGAQAQQTKLKKTQSSYRFDM